MNLSQVNQYLRSMELKKARGYSLEEYPYCVKAVRSIDRLDFHPKVTFFVGENGSGKSTILEAIATAYGFNPEGGTINFNFSTNDTHSELYEHIKLIKGVKKPQDGFFLRAESFYNLATNIEELEKDVPGMFMSYGGKSLHKQSHGESFFSVFMNRFNGRGLYILDEPEAALSPARQLSMIARMHSLLEKNSQFIIATHSPILMSYPDSTIYEVNDSIKEVRYEETEHYSITKAFLNNPAKMLKILIEENYD